MTNNRVWRLQTIGKCCTGNHQFFDFATLFASEARLRITRKLTLVKGTIMIVRVHEIR